MKKDFLLEKEDRATMRNIVFSVTDVFLAENFCTFPFFGGDGEKIFFSKPKNQVFISSVIKDLEFFLFFYY